MLKAARRGLNWWRPCYRHGILLTNIKFTTRNGSKTSRYYELCKCTKNKDTSHAAASRRRIPPQRGLARLVLYHR